MPYIVTFLAGCSTLIGFSFVNLKNRSNKVLISSLAFASGVMFLISVLDLIPTAFSNINSIYYLIPSFLIVSICVVVGLIFSMLIGKYLPDNSYNDSNLYKVGMISMLAIMFHNIPEDCSCYAS